VNIISAKGLLYATQRNELSACLLCTFVLRNNLSSYSLEARQ